MESGSDFPHAGWGRLRSNRGNQSTEIASIFPEGSRLEPAGDIDRGWCFRVVTPKGERFLAWTSPAKLGGLVEEDGVEFMADFGGAKDLRHQNVLYPLHFTQVGNRLVVVTEDFQGVPLHRIMENDRHPVDTVNKIFTGVTWALEAAHAAGVLHRALSPANILVDDSLNVRVFGFGMANLFFGRWKENLGVNERNAIDYLAPEALSCGFVGSEAHGDIFSFGRILYELMMGHVPKNSFVDLPSKVCGVPSYMDDALLKAMHGIPWERPQSIREFRQLFTGQRIREGDSWVAARFGSLVKNREKILEGTRAWIESVWFKVVAAAFVVLLGFTGWMIYEGTREDKGRLLTSSERMRAEELFREWEEPRHRDLEKFAESSPVQFERYVEDTHSRLVKEGNFRESRRFLDQVKGHHTDVFDARIRKWSRRIDEYEDMMDVARLAVASGQVFAAEAALARAIFYFPENDLAKQLMRHNPARIGAEMTKALDQLRQENPGQETWNYHLSISRDRVRLDLSGHRYLEDLSALRHQIIHELDLSDSGVESLEQLKGVPLDELRIDRTGIADLEPLGNLPLRVLTFRDARVTDDSVVERLESLRCVLGTCDGKEVVTIRPPIPGQKTWINADGLKFRLLPGTQTMMAEREIPRADGLGDWTSVTFNDAADHCLVLTERDRAGKCIGPLQRYRIPTDGEWSLAAQLPESLFLSPVGRTLQRITESDYLRNLRSHTVLEVAEGTANICRTQNGFLGLENEIGEWVRHDSNQLDDICLVRGVSQGDRLEKLRSRSRLSRNQPKPFIGFRPVLETGVDLSLHDRLIAGKMDSATLANIAVESWKTPFLSAAANSALDIEGLKTSQTYRGAFIGMPSRDVYPGTDIRYLRVDLPLPWNEARSLALRLGGRLVSVKDQGHLDWLKKRFVESGALGTPVWIGSSPILHETGAGWISRPSAEKTTRPLLVPGTGESAGPLLILQPIGERHSFLIEWDGGGNSGNLSQADG